MYYIHINMNVIYKFTNTYTYRLSLYEFSNIKCMIQC